MTARALSIVAALFVLGAFAGCSGDPCSEETGKVLCGYCSEDAMTSSNPAAGKCRYCDEGATCSGPICGDLQCVSGGGGGGGLNCACPQYSSSTSCGGTYCKNNLCSPAGWCCPNGCDGCGCR
jgi:hypothetical protein